MAPWIFFRFIYFPISSIFDILEKQNVELYFNIAGVVSIVVALYIGGSYGNPVIALIFLSVIGILLWGSINFYILRLAEVRCIKEAKFLIKYICMAFVISSPLLVVKYLSLSIYAILIVAFALTFVYYLVLMYNDVRLRGKLYQVIRTIKNKF